MHYGTETALKTLAKITALAAGAGLALFGAYTLWWRANFCTMMMQLNAAIPPRNLDNYLMRRLAQREICGFGDYALSYVGMIIGAMIATGAWHHLTRRLHRNTGSA